MELLQKLYSIQAPSGREEATEFIQKFTRYNSQCEIKHR